MRELYVKCLLYADDEVILAPSVCGLQDMVTKMNDSVKKRSMKEEKVQLNAICIYVYIYTDCNSLKQVKEFKYDAVEVRSLHDMSGVSLKDKCKKSIVREQCGLKIDAGAKLENAIITSHSIRVMNFSLTANEIICVGRTRRRLPRRARGRAPARALRRPKLDYGNEVCHPLRLAPRMGETRTGEVRFGTLNVSGGIDDKIDDVCELMEYRRLDILRVNETKRKASSGAIKRGSFDTYWSGVDQNKGGCRGVYAPDMSKPLEKREEFWANVRDILIKCSRNERIVKLDDFNGLVGVLRDGYEKVLVRKVVSEKKKVWLDLLSAKTNYRAQRKGILKDMLKDAESTYKDAKTRAKEYVKRRKNETKERYEIRG
ncbi:hypothetical protein EVAR_83964_1 [Eumeta japonica]|uniref:Reverse transcriptase domain-containing protein n=1 Tax=Eumeta variegata TaxID=151549 RepID=A0A4C1VR15_EUMVA|nr:hypothetical protein EVAR_83964_1 [Eumeta japonica]